jgi:5-deoxy-glucuronate isomerase
MTTYPSGGSSDQSSRTASGHEPGASPHHIKQSSLGRGVSVTVGEAGWRFLDFAVHVLGHGESEKLLHPGREVALVLLEGQVHVKTGHGSFHLARRDVFSEPPHVLYVPPSEQVVVEALDEACFSIGGAPAQGRYPLRLFKPEDMRAELRGGGAAIRQVNYLLAAPLPAERLILYEVIAERGTWCGWPPHCHDGHDGSPYLEETYYFRFDREEGYALHRNYRVGTDFDEIFVAGDGDLVLITEGYHTTVVMPGAHMYFLNYLAGELTDQDRVRPPCFDQRHTWITCDWTAGARRLPTPGINLGTEIR